MLELSLLAAGALFSAQPPRGASASGYAEWTPAMRFRAAGAEGAGDSPARRLSLGFRLGGAVVVGRPDLAGGALERTLRLCLHAGVGPRLRLGAGARELGELGVDVLGYEFLGGGGGALGVEAGFSRGRWVASAGPVWGGGDTIWQLRLGMRLGAAVPDFGDASEPDSPPESATPPEPRRTPEPEPEPSSPGEKRQILNSSPDMGALPTQLSPPLAASIKEAAPWAF